MWNSPLSSWRGIGGLRGVLFDVGGCSGFGWQGWFNSGCLD